MDEGRCNAHQAEIVDVETVVSHASGVGIDPGCAVEQPRKGALQITHFLFAVVDIFVM